MATVYFDKMLVNDAIKLLEGKGSYDKIDASIDIAQIDAIIACYINGKGYNKIFTEELDETVCRKHPIIRDIDALPVTKISNAFRNTTESEVDPLISKLNKDRYGILFDVLLKEGIVHKLEDFVNKVVE